MGVSPSSSKEQGQPTGVPLRGQASRFRGPSLGTPSSALLDHTSSPLLLAASCSDFPNQPVSGKQGAPCWVLSGSPALGCQFLALYPSLGVDSCPCSMWLEWGHPDTEGFMISGGPPSKLPSREDVFQLGDIGQCCQRTSQPMREALRRHPEI